MSHRAPAVTGVDAAPMGEQGQIMPWYPLQICQFCQPSLNSRSRHKVQRSPSLYDPGGQSSQTLGQCVRKAQALLVSRLSLTNSGRTCIFTLKKCYFKAKSKIVENKAPRSSPKYGLSIDFEGQTDTKIHLKNGCRPRLTATGQLAGGTCRALLTPGAGDAGYQRKTIGKPWCPADLLLSAEARVPYVRHGTDVATVPAAIGYPCSKFSRVCPNIGDTPWTP